jgi:hypothetical protein
MLAGRIWLPLGEGEGHLWQCRTKIPCLQKGASYPWEKERVIFGSAGLKFHVCRKELASLVRRRGSALVVQDYIKFHVCWKELATPVRRRGSALVGQDYIKFHVCRTELATHVRRRGSALVVQD